MEVFNDLDWLYSPCTVGSGNQLCGRVLLNSLYVMNVLCLITSSTKKHAQKLSCVESLQKLMCNMFVKNAKFYQKAAYNFYLNSGILKL